MSSNFALIENDTVVNVIFAESLETCQSIFPDHEIVSATNTEIKMSRASEIGMNWIRIDGKFYPPKPEGDVSWHEGFDGWLTAEGAVQWQEWYDKDVAAGLI